MTEHAIETVLPYDLYRDLLAKPWEGSGKCWGLVIEVCKRRGLHVDGDVTDWWEPAMTPHAGDVVMIRSQHGEIHAGVYVGDGRVLHVVADGSRAALSQLAAIERAKSVIGVYRWRGKIILPTVPEPDQGITVVYCPDILDPLKRQVYPATWGPGRTVKDYAPCGANAVIVNGKLLTLDLAPDVAVLERAIVVYATVPEGVPALASLAIGLVLSFISTLFAPAIPKASDTTDPGSPTFDLAGLRNTVQVGIVQPVVYGEHRVAGNIISAYQKADEQGRAVLHMAIMLSRGPIESIGGLIYDADNLVGDLIPTSIQIDGSPAKNYGVQVSVRLGGSNQEPLPGFGETTTVTSYTKTLLPTEAFVHQTTDAIESFDLLINYPLGLFNIDQNNGNVNGRNVWYQVRTRITGATSWAATNTYLHNGARRGPFTRQISVTGLTKNKYDIEITRFAENTGTPGSAPWPETSSDKESRSDLIAVNEIVRDTMAFPGKALLGVRAIATDQLSGGIPTITSVIKGRKVWVWDGVSETSPNFGTDETYSDNPAWCALDMLLNPHYGMAVNGKLTLNNIDLASFNAWATNCDTLVSDGRSGTVKRATCDLVVDQIQSGWEFLHAFALSHWGRLLVAGNKIRVVTEKVTTPVAVVGLGQVKDVVVTYEGRRQRPNTVEVQYFNEEANYENDFALRLDDAAVFTNGEPVVKESLQGVGVTRACHAYRLAQFRSNYHKLSKRRVEFTGGVEFIHLLPGDVIEFQHDSAKASTAVSGRVLSATSSTVRLDRACTITSGTNKITVRTSGTGADVLQERTLTNGTYARNAAITVTSSWTGGDVPVAGDPYVAGASATYYRLYRVLSVETDPSTLERRFNCAEYSDSIHSDDPGDVETFTDIMPDPRMLPDDVEDLTLSETTVVASDGSILDAIRAEWNPTEAWHGADVWVRGRTASGETDPPGWTHVVRTSSDIAVISPVGMGGVYEVSVTSCSKQGTRKHPTDGSRRIIEIAGRAKPPTSPSSVTARVIASVLYIQIDPPSDVRGVAGYEVRYGTTWAGSMKIGSRMPSVFSLPCAFTGTQVIRVKSISGAGIESDDEVTSQVDVSIPTSIYTATTTQTEHGAFAGTKTNTSVSSSKLVLSGSNLTGTYAIPTIAEAGTRRTVISVTAGLQNVAAQWRECAFRWDDGHADQTWATAYLNGYEVSHGLTWAQADVPWTGLVTTCHKWRGPIDIIEALEPSIDADFDGIDADTVTSVSGWELAVAATIDAILTLNRPYDRYVPECSAMVENVYQYA